MTGPKGNTVNATTIDGKQTRELFHFEDSRKEERSINIFGLSPDGKPYKLADLPDQHRNGWAWFPRWSPDGKTIAFGVGDENHQYWVMEDFLPAPQATAKGPDQPPHFIVVFLSKFGLAGCSIPTSIIQNHQEQP